MKPYPDLCFKLLSCTEPQVTLEVWKTDDFYQELVKTTAKLNDLAKSTAALTGTQTATSSVPDRDKVNKESLCIFLPFEQFESDK